MSENTKLEKQLLLGICALTILALSGIAIIVVFHGITAESGTLLGMIATGMLAIAKDIVQAIRGYSMSAQLGKVTDQLAASGPVAPDAATGKPDDPVNTKEVP